MGINAYRPWRRDVSYTVAVYDPTFETPVKATFDLRK
jgi:hypothetical protein